MLNSSETVVKILIQFLYLEDFLLGILETNLSGRRTRNDRNILKSTSTLASANTVIELFLLEKFVCI